MQKKKYKKPILEVEYYTLETTIAACGETSSSGGSGNGQIAEDEMFASVSAYAINGTNCSCYYSSGDSATTATSVS